MWNDTIEDHEDLIYRLSLAVNSHYSEIEKMTVWEIRQRAYFFGQKIISERLYMRDAYMSAMEILHRSKKDKGKKDTFEEHLLSIGYIHDRPYARYAKKRRELVRSNRGKNIEEAL